MDETYNPASNETDVPRLADYDLILLNTSGGKDSQAMIDRVARLASEAGLSERLVAVHADLGRVEWPGTAELAEEQVAHYGIRFLKVSRSQGDLVDHIRQRGKFPSSTTRYCTSDHKRGQVAKVLTMLAQEHRAAGGGQVRILNCLGFRREESPARRKKEAFRHDARATNTRRHVDEWLPVLEVTLDEVWETIRASGVRHHPAYDAGMRRLSCSFCVLASRSDLILAAQLRPALAREYADVEVEIGHRFTDHLSMTEVIELAASADAVVVPDWAA